MAPLRTAVSPSMGPTVRRPRLTRLQTRSLVTQSPTTPIQFDDGQRPHGQGPPQPLFLRRSGISNAERSEGNDSDSASLQPFFVRSTSWPELASHIRYKVRDGCSDVSRFKPIPSSGGFREYKPSYELPLSGLLPRRDWPLIRADPWDRTDIRPQKLIRASKNKLRPTKFVNGLERGSRKVVSAKEASDRYFMRRRRRGRDIVRRDSVRPSKTISIPLRFDTVGVTNSKKALDVKKRQQGQLIRTHVLSAVRRFEVGGGFGCNRKPFRLQNVPVEVSKKVLDAETRSRREEPLAQSLKKIDWGEIPEVSRARVRFFEDSRENFVSHLSETTGESSAPQLSGNMLKRLGSKALSTRVVPAWRQLEGIQRKAVQRAARAMMRLREQARKELNPDLSAELRQMLDVKAQSTTERTLIPFRRRAPIRNHGRALIRAQLVLHAQDAREPAKAKMRLREEPGEGSGINLSATLPQILGAKTHFSTERPSNPIQIHTVHSGSPGVHEAARAKMRLREESEKEKKAYLAEKRVQGSNDQPEASVSNSENPRQKLGTPIAVSPQTPTEDNKLWNWTDVEAPSTSPTVLNGRKPRGTNLSSGTSALRRAKAPKPKQQKEGELRGPVTPEDSTLHSSGQPKEQIRFDAQARRGARPRTWRLDRSPLATWLVGSGKGAGEASPGAGLFVLGASPRIEVRAISSWGRRIVVEPPPEEVEGKAIEETSIDGASSSGAVVEEALVQEATVATADAPSSAPSASSILAPPPHLSEAEAHIFTLLSTDGSLKPVTALTVQDISGGCGSMYAITIASKAFKGTTMVKQHRLVNAVLKEAGIMGGLHGLQLKTATA